MPDLGAFCHNCGAMLNRPGYFSFDSWIAYVRESRRQKTAKVIRLLAENLAEGIYGPCWQSCPTETEARDE